MGAPRWVGGGAAPACVCVCVCVCVAGGWGGFRHCTTSRNPIKLDDAWLCFFLHGQHTAKRHAYSMYVSTGRTCSTRGSFPRVSAHTLKSTCWGLQRAACTHLQYLRVAPAAPVAPPCAPCAAAADPLPSPPHSSLFSVPSRKRPMREIGEASGARVTLMWWACGGKVKQRQNHALIPQI